jgi:hypothetical protein
MLAAYSVSSSQILHVEASEMYMYTSFLINSEATNVPGSNLPSPDWQDLSRPSPNIPKFILHNQVLSIDIDDNEAMPPLHPSLLQCAVVATALKVLLYPA